MMNRSMNHLRTGRWGSASSLLALAGAVVIAASPVGAAGKAGAKKAGDEPVYCTLMGVTMKKSKAFGKTTVKGKTYYFCCKPCKTTFDKDPVKNAAIADKKLAARAQQQKKKS